MKIKIIQPYTPYRVLNSDIQPQINLDIWRENFSFFGNVVTCDPSEGSTGMGKPAVVAKYTEEVNHNWKRMWFAILVESMWDI